MPDIGELMLASFPHPSQFLRLRSPWHATIITHLYILINVLLLGGLVRNMMGFVHVGIHSINSCIIFIH